MYLCSFKILKQKVCFIFNHCICLKCILTFATVSSAYFVCRQDTEPLTFIIAFHVSYCTFPRERHIHDRKMYNLKIDTRAREDGCKSVGWCWRWNKRLHRILVRKVQVLSQYWFNKMCTHWNTYMHMIQQTHDCLLVLLLSAISSYMTSILDMSILELSNSITSPWTQNHQWLITGCRLDH